MSEDRLQRGRLPGRVTTQKTHELGLADLKIHVLEDVHLPVVGVDPVEPQERLCAAVALVLARTAARQD